jgi:sugar phosphate isomerase/epimerase
MMKMPKISLGSWAFSFGPFESDPWSFSQVSEYASQAGYDGIEINGFRPHPHPDDYDSDIKCKELQTFLSDLNLGISAYAPDFREVPPAEVSKESYLKELSKMLRFCNRMNIHILRVDSVSPPVEHQPEEFENRFSRLVDNWRSAAEECRKAGVMLVWEFEPGFWLNKPAEVKRLVETVNHDYFKLLYDTSHAYMGAVVGARQTGGKETLSGGVAEYASFLEGHIGHFHLIDSDGTLHDDETSTHSPFGEGYVDFKDVLTVMKPTLENLEWWCVDFCFCPTTDKDAKLAIPYIKNIVEQI